ncbi:MAG: HNH endonuclease, partial [Solirubrobacterales bacterium]
MIAVERGPCPESLAGSRSAGGIERKKALRFFSDGERRRRAFPFRAYKGDDVKAALTTMFGPKCAYCESDVCAVGPPDTEHYRPKAEIEIEGQRRRPGYYWLACDWENLLPSCYDCNRRRYQETTAGRRLSGKGNLFPLEDESMRAVGPGDEILEEPFLIDP